MKIDWLKAKELLKEIFTVKFLRILILMLFAAILFYLFSPKYQSCGQAGYKTRFNKVTGTTEYLEFSLYGYPKWTEKHD